MEQGCFIQKNRRYRARVYDVPWSSFSTVDADGLLVAVIIPPRALNTVIFEFPRRVVYGNPPVLL